MTRQRSEIEVELAAKALRRDEAAKSSLQSPSRLATAAVTLTTFIIVQALIHYWEGLPLYAGVAMALLVGAVVALWFEVAYARRRIDAMVHLLQSRADA